GSHKRLQSTPHPSSVDQRPLRQQRQVERHGEDLLRRHHRHLFRGPKAAGRVTFYQVLHGELGYSGCAGDPADPHALLAEPQTMLAYRFRVDESTPTSLPFRAPPLVVFELVFAAHLAPAAVHDVLDVVVWT